MKQSELVPAVRELATRTNASVGQASWYLFGSAKKELSSASDIDMVVICQTHNTADAIRRAVNVDQFARPIHLSILTRAEEDELGFVDKQGCFQIA